MRPDTFPTDPKGQELYDLSWPHGTVRGDGSPDGDDNPAVLAKVGGNGLAVVASRLTHGHPELGRKGAARPFMGSAVPDLPSQSARRPPLLSGGLAQPVRHKRAGALGTAPPGSRGADGRRRWCHLTSTLNGSV